jgi:hypothetical protein
MCCGIVTSASAQPAETNALEWRQIPVKNIRPGMLVWWIDPAHHSKPVEYQTADGYIRQAQSPKQMTASPKTAQTELFSTSVLQKPAGVSTFFADDANNVIWAQSTQDGFNQLKQIVEFLDRPIRKIDFDIKMVELVSPESTLTQNNPSLKKLFDPPTTTGTFSFNSISQSTLENLIKNGDAKIVKASQFTIRNNLTDRFTTATSAPVILDIKQADDTNAILSTQADKNNPLLLEKQLSVIFTPTINNDDTITIFMTISANAELTYNTPNSTNDLLWVKSLDNRKTRTTVFTIHSGDAIQFTGYNSTMLGIDDQNRPVVFSVKAQIEE